MKQVLHFITLGVHDPGLMKTFYTEKFGWHSLKDTGGIVFFKLNGTILPYTRYRTWLRISVK